MNRSIIFVLSLCVLIACASPSRRTLASYATSEERTTTVTEMCAEFPSRQDITSDEKDKQKEDYNKAMDTAFTPTGTDLYNSLMSAQTNDSSDLIGRAQASGQQVLKDYPTLPQQFGMFVGPFVLFFILTFMSALCCCCCCARGCCCCFAKTDEPYSKAQLLCPTIFLLGATAMVTIVSIMGMAQSANIETTLKASGCSVAIILDDFLNGNVSDSTSGFFAGLKETSNQLEILKNDIDDVQDQFQLIQTGSASAGQVNGAYTQAKLDLNVVPNLTPGALHASFSYNGPFITATTSTQNVASDFPTYLGSTGAGSGYVYYTDQVLDATKDAIDVLTDLAQTVAADMGTGGDFQAGIDDAQSIIDDVSDLVQNADQNYYDSYIKMYPILEKITYFTTVFYGVLIGLSAIMILATILAVVCSRYKCRYLMYLACLLLVFLGVIALLIAAIMSFIVPTLYFGCDFFSTAFGSKQGFENTIGNNLGDDISNFMTVCLPGESGNLLDSDFFGDLTDSMNDFKDLLNDLQQFDDTDLNDQIDTAWGDTKDYIQDSYSGAVLDFSDTTNKQYLENIADPLNNYAGCVDANFLADRWVPTVSTPNDIACQLGSSANQATSTECNPQTNFNPTPSAFCQQCMDSQSILTQLDTQTGGNIVGALDSRYGQPGSDADCGTFADHLDRIYVNYYEIKQSVYPLVIGRANTADASIVAYKGQITDINTDFKNCINNLQSLMDDVVNSQTGLINGFNCAVFGQDINLIISTACDHLFVTTYFLRLSLGMAGIGIFFTMCFGVCAGVRVFLHEKITNQKINDKLNNQMENTRENLNQPQTKGRAFDNKMQDNWVEPKKKRTVAPKKNNLSYFA